MGIITPWSSSLLTGIDGETSFLYHTGFVWFLLLVYFGLEDLSISYVMQIVMSRLVLINVFIFILRSSVFYLEMIIRW